MRKVNKRERKVRDVGKMNAGREKDEYEGR